MNLHVGVGDGLDLSAAAMLALIKYLPLSTNHYHIQNNMVNICRE